MNSLPSTQTPDGFMAVLRNISPALVEAVTRTDARRTSLNLTTPDSHAASVIGRVAARWGLHYSQTLEHGVYHFTLKNFAR